MSTRVEMTGARYWHNILKDNGGINSQNVHFKNLFYTPPTGEWPRLLCIGPRGSSIAFKKEPPRQRGLVIGLSKNNEAVVAFPEANSISEGYHYLCEGFVFRYLNGNLKSILHGYIGPEKNEGARRAHHTVTIFKMPPEDTQRLMDSGARISPYEEGSLYPEEFLSEQIIQNLLHGLGAKKLEITYGTPSLRLYKMSSSGT